jgi:hypothetical protein
MQTRYRIGAEAGGSNFTVTVEASSKAEAEKQALSRLRRFIRHDIEIVSVK